jgi:alkaline phosphatase D
VIKHRIFFPFLLLILFCFSANAQEKRKTPFNYGVASGDPLQDRVIIWTRIDDVEGSADVNYEISATDDFAAIITSGVIKTDKDKDFTVKADIENLKPDTYYYYRFKYKNSYSIAGRTKTLPVKTRKFKVAFVSCQNFGAGYFTAYKHIIDDDPDLVVMLGDFIYEYARTGSSREDTSGYARDLESYRTKYKVYLTDPYLKDIRSKIPMVAIWDDHEVENDYSGVNIKKVNPQRIKDAYQVYFEYLPAREQGDNKLYRNFKIGDLVDLYMLDGRQYKDEPACEDAGINFKCNDIAAAPGRTYLGTEQKKWLLNGLENSNSQWKILGNNTLMMEISFLGNQINFDQWDGYKAEKEEILKDLKDKKVKDLLVFSGDVHTFVYGDILYNGEKIAPEIVTGSITSPNPSVIRDFQALVPLMVTNIKYFNPNYHGYLLADFQQRKVDVYYYGVVTTENDANIAKNKYRINIGSEKVLLKHLEIHRARKPAKK